MAVVKKDKDATVSVAKRTITATSVSIQDGIFVDENGNIAESVKENLPDGIDKFDIKITIEFPEDSEE